MSEKKKELEVKVTASESDGVLQFEGSLTLPNLTKSKLTNKDGVTKFETITALKAVARRVAERLSYDVVYDEEKAQRRVAAKKSAAAKKSSTATAPTVL